MMQSGNAMADMRLRRDDVVYVPSASERFISVLGEVQHPGAIPLAFNSTLASILAQAGGITDHAGTNPHIQVVDPASGTSRVISLKDVLNSGQVTRSHAQAGRNCLCAEERLLQGHVRIGTAQPNDLRRYHRRLCRSAMSLQRIQSDGFSQVHPGNGNPGATPPVNHSYPPAGNERPLLRLNLVRALQLHRNLALGIAAAGFILALAYIVKSWPVYLAQSQIYIQPAQSKVIPQGYSDNEPINSTAYDSFVQEQVQNATNSDVLLNALHKLPKGAWGNAGESEQAAADSLGHAIEVARVATSYQVSITAKAKSGPLAAQIANAVAASVVEKAAGEGNAGDAQRIAVLTDERTRIQNQLNSDYTEQSDLNKELGMAAVGTSAPDLIDDEIGKTREELIKAQTDHDEAEARYTSMKAGQGDSSAAMNAEADDMIAADAGLTSMKSSLNTRRALLISQMANLTPTNPEYKQDAAELAKINTGLDSMMKDLRANAASRIQQKLRTDLERTAGVEAQLNGQLRQLAQTAASATPKLQRVNDLSTDIARLRNRYTVVDEQLHNLIA